MSEIHKKLARLAAPFPPAAVKWRIGVTTKDKSKAMALAYLDSRDVMDRFDLVLGTENWQCKHEVTMKPGSSGSETVSICHIGVKIGDEWVWKSDGAGESKTEGVKGSLSDSEKRAAVQWGVGRYLYRLDSPWVDTSVKGRSTVIAEGEKAHLRSILSEAVYNASPVYGMRIDSEGNELMSREDIGELFELCQMRLSDFEPMKVTGFDAEMVMRSLLSDTDYQGWSMRDLAMARRSSLPALKDKLAKWKPPSGLDF
jgi:hypothetical protein